MSNFNCRIFNNIICICNLIFNLSIKFCLAVNCENIYSIIIIIKWQKKNANYANDKIKKDFFIYGYDRRSPLVLYLGFNI